MTPMAPQRVAQAPLANLGGSAGLVALGPVQAEPGPQARRRTTAELLMLANKSPNDAARHRILDEVVLLNMPVARNIARRHRNRGVPLEDLEQVAYLALLGAARRFDTSQSHDFLTFAVPTVGGELKKYFRDHAWTVRPPRCIQEIQASISRVGSLLTQRLGRTPTSAELADTLCEDESLVNEALAASSCYRPDTLDRLAVGDSPTTTGHPLGADDETAFEVAEIRVMLRPAIRRLSARDRHVLHLRYFEGRTQREIAADIGASQVQVSRILARIVRSIRCDLEMVSVT